MKIETSVSGVALKIQRGDVGRQILSNLKHQLARELELGITDIQARVAAGRKIDGGAFKPYSKMYIERLKAEQRWPGKQWLIYNNTMLKSMRSKIRAEGRRIIGTIFFLNSRDKDGAYTHAKVRGNNPTRPFLGFSEEQRYKLKANLEKVFK